MNARWTGLLDHNQNVIIDNGLTTHTHTHTYTHKLNGTKHRSENQKKNVLKQKAFLKEKIFQEKL